MEQNILTPEQQKLQDLICYHEQKANEYRNQYEQSKCQCQTCMCHKNWNDINAVRARLAELEAEAAENEENHIVDPNEMVED